MLRLKPTTIIALDLHAAALCEAVSERLKRGFGDRGKLIQAFALVRDGSSLRFEENLSSISDATFDLEAARNDSSRIKPDEASELFGNARAMLEPDLRKMLGAARRSVEIQAAQRAGIEVANNQLVILTLSAADPFAGGVALELAWLIRWLFATFFPEEAFSLQAVILLPSLFINDEAEDYAATYALLKKLDYQIENGFIVLDTQPTPPFEYCWLIDRHNARGNELDSLASDLNSYSDAIAGFLTADPEMSGAVASHRVRGKVQAYSTFGHGELYFSAEVSVTRLSAAFASDVITKAYLSEGAPIADYRRKLLLAAKQFVLKGKFLNALADIETDKGAQIWRPFDPGLEMHERREQEYVNEVNIRAEKFKNESLLKYRETLETQREQVRGELIALLDDEINRHADSTPNGLRIAAEWLHILIERSIALEAHILGDHPQNLVTEKLAADCSLDSKLAFSPDTEKTKTLLEEINRLRNQLDNLRTMLRLLPTDEQAEQPSRADEGNKPTASDERQKVLDEMEKLQTRLRDAEEEYRRAVIDEDTVAGLARYDATNKAREMKATSAGEAERQLYEMGDQLRVARQELDILLEQRQAFARRYFIFYPAVVFALAFIFPAILAPGGIGPAQAWLEFYTNNLSSVLFCTIVVALIYYGVMFFKFSTGINRLVKQAQDSVERLKGSLSGMAVMLRKAHNDRFQLEYQLHAQRVRSETIMAMVDAARQKASELRDKITALNQLRLAFDQQHEEAKPYSSMSQRSVLRTADIDAYYAKVIASGSRQAEEFSNEQVKRSQLRRLPIEEFRAKLDDYARKQFRRLNELSIEDILLRERDLLSADVANQRLRELDDASQPLLRLNDTDSNLAATQRDVTMWAGVGEHDEVLTLYKRICETVTLRTYKDERRIRVLMRYLYFPAYFLGQIQYYRHSYLEADQKGGESLPDLIPSELGITGALKRAQERFLLATALGLIERREDGSYYYGSGNGVSLGASRMEIARKLATDPASQQVYSNLCAALDKQSDNRALVYQRLNDFLVTTPNLEGEEQEAIDSLIQKFHPLR